jgi:hypothetical protein
MKYPAALGLLMLTACGLLSEQGVYDGVRQQQQIRRDPTLPDDQRLPDYDKYQKEREKLKPSPA